MNTIWNLWGLTVLVYLCSLIRLTALNIRLNYPTHTKEHNMQHTTYTPSSK